MTIAYERDSELCGELGPIDALQIDPIVPLALGCAHLLQERTLGPKKST